MVAVERGVNLPMIDGNSVPLIGPSFDPTLISKGIKTRVLGLFTLPRQHITLDSGEPSITLEETGSTCADADAVRECDCVQCGQRTEYKKEKSSVKKAHRFSQERFNWLLAWCTGGRSDDELIKGRILFLVQNFTDYTYFRPFDTIESSKVHLVKQIRKGTGKTAVVRLSTSKPGDITIGHLCYRIVTNSDDCASGTRDKTCDVISLSETISSNLQINRPTGYFDIMHQRFSVYPTGCIGINCSDGSIIKLPSVKDFVSKYYQAHLEKGLLKSIPEGLLNFPSIGFENIPVCGYEDF